MELIAKFYPNYWSDKENIINQEPITSEVVVSEELKGFDSATFDMPIFDGITRDVKVELYEVNTNNDLLVFSGYVYEIKPKWKQFDVISVEARSGKFMMNKRNALQEYALYNTDIKVIIETLLAKYNTDFGDHWTVETDFTANIAELKVGLGDEYFGVFDELAEETDSYWFVNEGVVSFSKKSGKDLTSSTLAEYDGMSPNPGNINTIEIVETATSASIVIVEEINGTKRVDSSKFDGFCLGVAQKTVRKGDLVDKTEMFYENINKPQRSYKIEIINNSIDVHVGDTIQVNVFNTNSFYDYDGGVIVITKKTTYNNSTKKIEYGIGEFVVAPFGIQTRLSGVEKQIKLLKLK